MKNTIAKNINTMKNLQRTLVGSFDEDSFGENTIFDNLGKASSWTDGGVYIADENMFQGVKVILNCKNVECHEVDYNNVEEAEILGADGCEIEQEFLVPSETQMMIKEISFEYKEFYPTDNEDDNYSELSEIWVELEVKK